MKSKCLFAVDFQFHSLHTMKVTKTIINSHSLILHPWRLKLMIINTPEIKNWGWCVRLVCEIMLNLNVSGHIKDSTATQITCSGKFL